MNTYNFHKTNLLTLSSQIVLFRHSKFFRWFTTFVIIIYSIILGVKTHTQDTMLHNVFAYTDIAVTIYFVVELLIKLYSEPNKKEFFKDGWNLFDTFIVLASLVPLNAFESILIARLFRIFRVLRLITINDKIKKLIVALEGAIPHICNILVLMFIVFYIYAIIGHQFFSELQSGLWENFSISMLTLFRVLTFEDWTDVMYEAMEVHPMSWIYFVSFIIINAFVIFNLFVAVIINEISKIKDNDISMALNDENHELHIIINKLNTIESQIQKTKEI